MNIMLLKLTVSARGGEPESKPEPLEKKTGAGATKKLAGSSALLEDKKHKGIVLLLLFLR